MPSTVRKGDRGSDVKLCQELLSKHGFSTSADGIFGSGTEDKVMQFQRAKSLGADGIVGSKTWAALQDGAGEAPKKDPPSPLPPVLVHMKSLGHEIMWEGDYHLNLFGIRNPSTKSGSFDDTFGCAYTEKGLWKVHFWPSTCDPGTYWLENPMNVAGTAVLVPGQYSSWKIGLHRGSYEALIQTAGSVKVWRDSNKDEVLDHPPGSEIEGYFGINLHRSSTSGESTVVGKWSAGCQVHARLDAFNEMMQLAHKQQDTLGVKVFTYTLMDQWW